MENYKLSNQASIDIAEAFEYGVDNFGLKLTKEYFNQMENMLEVLYVRPELWRDASYIKRGLLNYKQKSHIIFFYKKDNRIFVSRILEQHMDFKIHL